TSPAKFFLSSARADVSKLSRIWTQHTSGRIETKPGRYVHRHSMSDRAISTSAETLSQGAHYHALAECGMHYGPAFRVVSEVQCGARRSRARIEIPAERDRIAAASIALDAAMQTAATILPLRDGRQPFVPATIRHVHF